METLFNEIKAFLACKQFPREVMNGHRDTGDLLKKVSAREEVMEQK